MGKIATEQEVYNVGQTGTPTANKCCTKQRMEALGCEGINGVENYASNRLVPEGNYIKNVIGSFKLSFQSYTYKPVFHASNAIVTDAGNNEYLVKVTDNNWNVVIELYINYYMSIHYINYKEQTLNFSVRNVIGTNNCSVSYNTTNMKATITNRDQTGFGYGVNCNFGSTTGQINCTGYILKN